MIISIKGNEVDQFCGKLTTCTSLLQYVDSVCVSWSGVFSTPFRRSVEFFNLNSEKLSILKKELVVKFYRVSLSILLNLNSLFYYLFLTVKPRQTVCLFLLKKFLR